MRSQSLGRAQVLTYKDSPAVIYYFPGIVSGGLDDSLVRITRAHPCTYQGLAFYLYLLGTQACLDIPTYLGT